MADTKKYSFSIGLQKAIVSASIFGLSLMAVFVSANYPELNNQPVVDVAAGIVKEHLSTIFGSMTVGGVIALAVNWLKIRYSQN